MVLKKEYTLPSEAVETDVGIRLFAERRRWRRDAACLDELLPRGMKLDSGVIQLGERVSVRRTGPEDLVVEVVVAGKIGYRAELKDEAEGEVGFVRCTNGYFIDEVYLSTPLSDDPAYPQQAADAAARRR